MSHLEGTLCDQRPLPRVSRPKETIYTPNEPSLLDDVESALFGGAEQPVRFAAPVRESVLSRNSLDHTAPARPIVSPLRKLFKIVRYGALASMIGYGGFLGYSIWYGPLGGETTASAQSGLRYHSEGVTEVSVAKPEVQSYDVAASQPKRLQLAGQDIHARIQAQGMTDEAQLLTAKNTNDIAWYSGSATPGRSGVAVMVGALAGPTKPSNFATAGKTAVGDKITVTMGDDSAVFYRVKSVATVPDIGDTSTFLSQGVSAETLKLVLRDKVAKTADKGATNVVIVGERFQDPLPKYKSLRRW